MKRKKAFSKKFLALEIATVCFEIELMVVMPGSTAVDCGQARRIVGHHLLLFSLACFVWGEMFHHLSIFYTG